MSSLFMCDIKELRKDYIDLARTSYKMHGAFLLKRVVSENKLEALRQSASDLFNKSGDSRRRCLHEVDDSAVGKSLVDGFALRCVSKVMDEVFPDPDVSLYPPFDIVKNYLPHSRYTSASGWHRDCGGESKISECVKCLESDQYVFGKIGMYLQDNSIYGGGIDLILGSHKDYFHNRRGLSWSTIVIKILTVLQSTIPFIYNYLSNKEFTKNFLGAVSLSIEAGDVAVFDARIWHKGTFASKEIENILEYDHDKLQAHLPEKQAKYVFYSHFGNSTGLRSYFIDRLARKGNEDEIECWSRDTERLNLISRNQLPKFFRDAISLLDGSFLKKYSK